MTRLPRVQYAMPQLPHVHLEIAKAIRTLTRSNGQWSEASDEIAKFRSDRDELAEIARYVRQILRKEGFNPNEPQVPAGNPDGGQWTREGGNGGPTDPRVLSDATADNTWKPGAQYAANWPHHYVPWATINDFPELPEETRQVFIDATSGPLTDINVNRWSKEHAAYNAAVDQLFDDFVKSYNITVSQMTPDQAWELIDEVFYSSDPRIRRFNMRIWNEEFKFRIRGGGGDEE